MKILSALIMIFFFSITQAQILPGVDPKVGPVAGETYIDPSRWTQSRLKQLVKIEEQLNSRTLTDPTISFNLTSVPLSEVIQLYFSEVVRVPYVICSDVLSDGRFVSLRATGTALDRAMMEAMLEVNGLALQMTKDIAMICTKEPELTKEEKAARNGKIYTYSPKNRSVSDLIRLARPLVIGVFANGSAMGTSLELADSRSSRATTDLTTDTLDEVLVFSSEEEQIERLRQILHALDTPSSSVMVRAVLYEVAQSDINASALKVIADMFKGRLGVTFGSNAVGANTFTINSSHFDFVASMISEDSRFKILTQPFLRVQNGKRARFQVGQDVPVQGEILFNPNGQSSQSVKYVSSGVILDVGAQVRGEAIALDLTQTVSNFVKTTVGNSDNPTLNKRELSTTLTVGDGEIVLLGGLSDGKYENSRQGLFGWNFAKSKNSENAELVLLLQAEKI